MQARRSPSRCRIDTHQFDVADAVLEADQVRATVSQLLQHGGVQADRSENVLALPNLKF
jgi:hypothetical protein